MIRLTRPLIAASFKRMSMIASANKISASYNHFVLLLFR